MPRFKITYARLITLTTDIEAYNKEQALVKAQQKEMRRELGLITWTAKPGSEVESVQDYDQIWEAEEID